NFLSDNNSLWWRNNCLSRTTQLPRRKNDCRRSRVVFVTNTNSKDPRRRTTLKSTIWLNCCHDLHEDDEGQQVHEDDDHKAKTRSLSWAWCRCRCGVG
ncbi:unnamed protein product, partial [Amoebophrya sp. A25]